MVLYGVITTKKQTRASAGAPLTLLPLARRSRPRRWRVSGRAIREALDKVRPRRRSARVPRAECVQVGPELERLRIKFESPPAAAPAPALAPTPAPALAEGVRDLAACEAEAADRRWLLEKARRDGNAGLEGDVVDRLNVLQDELGFHDILARAEREGNAALAEEARGRLAALAPDPLPVARRVTP